MSELWLAHDTHSRKSVVLKIMKIVDEDERRNRKTYERFWREIEIARSLQHPYILPIIDYGEFVSTKLPRPFLVTPYIAEGSLADRIQASPPWENWSLAQTADVILQAADSLWYLHTRSPQIVHEDVKPGNFLVSSVESANRLIHLYLCDFGISRWLRSSSVMASEVLGTFAYMAPEQIARKVNRASDQYALAVMACHLLTGKLPIQAATNEEYAHAHVHQRPSSPSQLNPRRINAPEVDEVILRALEKKPERRFPTILEFARALQRVLTDVTKRDASVTTERMDPALADTFVQTKPQKTRIAAASVLSLPPVAPDIFIVIDPPEQNDEKILDEPLPTKPSRVVVVPPKNGDGMLTRLPLANSQPLDLPARPRTLSWSRDGNQLACTCYSYVPLVITGDGSIQEIRAAWALHATSLCWSGKGHILAVSAQGEIHFWNRGAQEALPLVLKSNVRVLDGLDWSAHGQLALWIEDSIHIYSLSSALLKGSRAPIAQTISTGPMRCGNAGTLRWSPDGTLLVAGASNGSVLCWDLAQQTPVWQVAPLGQKVTHLTWSPDGTLLCVAFRDNRIVGWDVRTREQIMHWENLPALPRVISVSTEHDITIASAEKRLLSGLSDDPQPSMVLPGQLLVAWSPVRTELVTLSERRETTLVVWQT